MWKVLLTGASGFLGRKIMDLWDNRQMMLFASTGNPNKITRNDVAIISREDTLNTYFDLSQFDIIINCAFPMTTDGLAFFEGLDYIQKLIQRAEKSGVNYFVNISSQSVYDPLRKSAAMEEDMLCLRDQYSVGKYTVESMMTAICRDMHYTSIRLGSLIGPELEARIVNRFVLSAVTNHKIKVVKGYQLFQYLDVQDAARGIVEFCKYINNEGLQKVYNLGGNDSYTVMELANMVCEVGTNQGLSKVDIMVEDSEIYTNNSLNSDRFFERTKWKPEITMIESINKIYRYLLH